MKHNVFQKWTSLVLALLMVITMVPIFTLTARAAEDTYKKVTSIEPGKYVITLTYSNTDYAISTVSGTWLQKTSTGFSISNDSLTITDTALVYEVAAIDGTSYYSIKNVSTNKYLGWNNSNTIKEYSSLQSTDEYTSWDIAAQDNGTMIIYSSTKASSPRYLANNGASGLRAYQTTNTGVHAFTFYKLDETAGGGSEPECQHTNTTTVAEVPATCTTAGTTAGVVCADCGEVISGCEPIDALGHTYENGSCTVCGAAEPVKYTKVTNIADLHAGDQIVLVYGNYAMGSQNAKNYRDKVDVVVIGNYFEHVDGVCVLTLGGSAGAWTLKADDGYLYYSGSGNSLDTLTTLEGNSGYTWTIDIADGTATIQSVDYNTRYLQYNTGSPRFACYLSTSKQQNVTIYKITPTIKTVGLTLNKGVTVDVKLNIPEAWLAANADAWVVFSNGMKFEAVKGENTYSVDLTPAQINDDLTVQIVCGETVVFQPVSVSVATYKAKAKAAGYIGVGISEEKFTALLNLIDAALVYSNAADKTDEDLTTGFEGFGDHSYTVNNPATKLLTGFAGTLSTYASIRVNVNTTDYIASDVNLIVTFDGKQLHNGTMADGLVDGCIVINNLCPADFNKTITIETNVVGASATFTFNSYLKALYEDEGADQQVKNFVVATYQYGLAAEAYNAAK